MYAAKSSCLPPEDIAIRAAQAVAIFQAELEGTTPIIHASDVFVIGSNWQVIVDSLRAPDERIKSKQFGRFPPEIDLSFGRVRLDGIVRQRDESKQLTETAHKQLLSKLNALDAELEARVAAVVWEIPRVENDSVDVSVVDAERSINKRDFHCRPGDCSSLLKFAVVLPTGKLPKVKRGASSHCVCHVPWNQRSRWERSGYVEYKLPCPSAAWEAVGTAHSLPSGSLEKCELKLRGEGGSDVCAAVSQQHIDLQFGAAGADAGEASPPSDGRNGDDWLGAALASDASSDSQSCASSLGQAGRPTLTNDGSNERALLESDASEEHGDDISHGNSNGDSDAQSHSSGFTDDLLTPRARCGMRKLAETPAWKPERLRRRRASCAQGSDMKGYASECSSFASESSGSGF